MITFTSLKHPSIRSRLMTAHKRAIRDEGRQLHSDTLPISSGHLCVFWLPYSKRFKVYHIDHSLQSRDITEAVAAAI